MVDNIDPVASLQKYISTNKQFNEKFILLNFEFVVINRSSRERKVGIRSSKWWMPTGRGEFGF